MAKGMDLVIGIALIVVGALLLLGYWTVGWLLPYLGIVLIVAGILMLLGKLAGGMLVGILALVFGILLVLNFIDFPGDMKDFMRNAMGIINLVAGIVFVVLGIMKLAGK